MGRGRPKGSTIKFNPNTQISNSIYGKYLTIICSKCKVANILHVGLNWETIYTEEVISKWQCWKCRANFKPKESF